MTWALAERPDLDGHRVGPWRLHVRLGPNSWRGVDERTDAAVVVRVAAPGTPGAVMVRAEADALAALGPRHLPGLVRPAGEVVGPNMTAIATVAVDGPTIAERLAADRPLPWPEAAGLLAPIAEALAGMHAAGWVHGDVAPTNVVAAGSGAVLVDLGCARPIPQAGATGSPGWVAPEVAAGRPVTPAAEVWSLATMAGAITTRGTGAPAPLPAGAVIALGRALADDAADRPSARELAAALLAAAAQPPPTLVPPPAPVGDPRQGTTRDYGPRPPAPPALLAVPRRAAGPVVAGAAALVLVLVLIVGAAVAGWPPARPVVDPEPDVVVLGDWDCDGVDTPGTYRPATGAITLWNGWPLGDRPVAPAVRSAAAPGGTASVEAAGAGCDRLVITRSR